MPTEDDKRKKWDKAGQHAHADLVRVARAAGITPNEMRKKLKEFARQDKAEQARKAAQPPATPVAPAPVPPVLSTPEMKFEPRPFVLAPGTGAKTGQEGTDVSGFSGDLVVCEDNGDSTYTRKTAHYENGVLKTVS